MEVHELSSSASACINSINHYAFEGDMDIVDAGVPGFMTERVDLSLDEKLQYIDALKNLGVKLTDIISLTKSLERNYKSSGNAYLYIRKYNVMGEQRIKVESIHPLNLAYIKPDDNDSSGIKTFAFSENFDQTRSYQFKYKLIRAYPDWSEGDGFEECIYHIKNITGKSTWYGRPNSLSVLYEMISEMKAGEQRMKVSNSDFVSTMILAFEQDGYETDTQSDEDKEGEAIRTGKVLRAAMTNAGDNPSALMTIDYPHGGNAPTPIEVNVNRDYQYMKESNDISSGKIYGCFDWARELTGNVSVKGGIGSNLIKDMLSVKYTTTIQPLQEFWSHEWKTVLDNFIELPYALKYPNLIENYNWNVDQNRDENRDNERITEDGGIDNI